MGKIGTNVTDGGNMTSEEIIRMFEERRTIRRFDESKKIDDMTVCDMKRAAQLASSAMNRQPMRYIYVRDEDTVNAIFDITMWGAALPDGKGRPKKGERPAMFVVVLYEKELSSRYVEFDSGLAVSNITLAAHLHGVASCILGSANEKKLRDMLSIPENLELSCAVAFGYPACESRTVESDGENLKYYLDDNNNFVVPKRKIEDVTFDI